MRRYRAPLLLAALLLLAGSVSAEEVVHFKSGAALPIVSHKIDGEMIHVDLGGNGFMAFPLAVVDRVEKAGKNVMIGRSTVGGTNVMSARPDPTGSFPVQGTLQSSHSETNRYDDSEREFDPAIDVVDGVAVYRPLAGSGNPAKAATALTGHARVRENAGSPGALRGARQVGTRQVIGEPPGRRNHPSTGPAPVITGIEFRGAPAPPASGDGSGNAESGDSSQD